MRHVSSGVLALLLVTASAMFFPLVLAAPFVALVGVVRPRRRADRLAALLALAVSAGFVGAVVLGQPARERTYR